LRSPSHVLLSGESPFAGPVVVRWRGMQVERTAEGARVTFPDGATATWEGGEPSIIKQLPLLDKEAG